MIDTASGRSLHAAMLLIVWHSRTGAARAMAEAARRGAVEQGEVRSVRADAAEPDDLRAAQGYLFVCPENLASMSGTMKEFFDRCYYPVLGRIEGRAYATAIAAGSDGSGAERQIDRIATGWRLRRVAPGLIVNTAAQTPDTILAPKILAADDLRRCEELGATLAAGLTMGAF